MKKSNRRNAKQGLATRLKLPFVTQPEKEHFGAGRFKGLRKPGKFSGEPAMANGLSVSVNLSELHTLQCIERIKALNDEQVDLIAASIWVVPRIISSLRYLYLGDFLFGGKCMKITDELIDYIGELSRLELSASEKERAKKDLTDIDRKSTRLNSSHT
jgi:hypothetical protein